MLPGDLYRFLYVDDPDLQLILKVVDIDILPKLYLRADLKRTKTYIHIFMWSYPVGIFNSKNKFAVFVRNSDAFPMV